MKKNKKIWSYALACALAMSNLSVVAAPFTSIVAQAKATAVSFAETTAVPNDSVNITYTGADANFTEGDSIVVQYSSDGGNTWKNVTDQAELNSQKTAVTLKATGIFKLVYTPKEGSAVDSTNTVTVSTPATASYDLTLDGNDNYALPLVPGKSYAIRLTETKSGVTKEITSNAKAEVTGPATYANGTLTVNSNAIENATVSLAFTPSGAASVPTGASGSWTVGTKSSTQQNTINLSLAPADAETVGSTPITVLVGGAPTAAPAGYSWVDQDEDENTGIQAFVYDAFILSGDGINSVIPTDDAYTNKFTVTGNPGDDKKATGKIRYTLSATAKPTDPSSEKPIIKYFGQIDQNVTAYPTATYKLTVTGTNAIKDDQGAITGFELKEEEGKVVVTASVDPTGSDMPQLKDVKYAWSSDNTTIKVVENGASATITPRTPFTVASATLNLKVTDKNGSAIDGLSTEASSGKNFEIKLSTNQKPTLVPSATDVKEGTDVTVTVKDAKGKTVAAPDTDYVIVINPNDISDPSTLITGATAYTKNPITLNHGPNTVYALDVTRKVLSDPVDIIVRSESDVRATDLKLSVDNLTMDKATANFDATVLPYDESDSTKSATIANVRVTSNDEKVVEVQPIGQPTNNTTTITLKAVDPGETTVDVVTVDGKIKKTLNVTVPGYKGIVISSDKTEVVVGDTIKMSADVQVYGSSFSKDIIWKTSDESVATVKDGVVTGVAEGTAKIYAVAKNDATRKSNEITITVKAGKSDKEIAIEAANAAAAAAVANPTDATIKAAQDAIAAAKKAGATDADLKAATDNLTKAEAAKKAADEKQKEEEQKSDGSAAGTPAPKGNELKDATGATTGFVVTNATPGKATVEYKGNDADKKAKSVTIPDTTKDHNGNEYKVTSIAANAFAGADTTKVTIGKNIKKIDPNAFKSSKVKKVIVKGTKFTKKMAKAINKLKKGSTVKVTGKNKKANKKIFNALKNVKNGKIKVK